MSNLVLGIFLGLLGFGIISGILFVAFTLGTRQKGLKTKAENLPPSPPEKRRVPTAGSTIPSGAIAQTQFSVSGHSGASSPSKKRPDDAV